MKTIEVAAAVIMRDDCILATQRGYGEFKGGWEFPGGKREAGESLKETLAREMKEELDIEVAIGERLDTIEFDYPAFHLTMHCFLCTISSGTPILKEHEAAKWLTKEELYSVEWLPADIRLLGEIEKLFLEN